MEGFQKSVLVIAIITLILTLVLIGLALNSAKNNMSWPPLVGSCPDYWVDLSGNGAACFNPKKLGHCNIPTSASEKNTMDFSGSIFTGDDGLCNKKKWATNCSDPNNPVTWDGITYGVVDPCETSGSGEEEEDAESCEAKNSVLAGTGSGTVETV
jgi:hypothetical protein